MGLFFILSFSPGSLLWGSLRRKRLAAICPGRVPGACPPLSALYPPWFRLVSARVVCAAASPHFVRDVSAVCPPCVRLESALAPPPIYLACHLSVRLVSAICPPRVRLVSASKPCTPYVRHVTAPCPPPVRFGRGSKSCPPLVFASCVSTMCPLFVRHAPALCQLRSTMCPRLWTLFARHLLWGRAVASWSKKLSQHCATHHVYIACPLVSFLGIHFGSTNFGLCQRTLCLKNSMLA